MQTSKANEMNYTSGITNLKSQRATLTIQTISLNKLKTLIKQM